MKNRKTQLGSAGYDAEELYFYELNQKLIKKNRSSRESDKLQITGKVDSEQKKKAA